MLTGILNIWHYWQWWHKCFQFFFWYFFLFDFISHPFAANEPHLSDWFWDLPLDLLLCCWHTLMLQMSFFLHSFIKPSVSWRQSGLWSSTSHFSVSVCLLKKPKSLLKFSIIDPWLFSWQALDPHLESNHLWLEWRTGATCWHTGRPSARRGRLLSSTATRRNNNKP